MTKSKHLLLLLVIILLTSNEAFPSEIDNNPIDPVYSKSQVDSFMVKLRQDMKTEIKNDVILEAKDNLGKYINEENNHITWLGIILAAIITLVGIAVPLIATLNSERNIEKRLRKSEGLIKERLSASKKEINRHLSENEKLIENLLDGSLALIEKELERSMEVIKEEEGRIITLVNKEEENIKNCVNVSESSLKKIINKLRKDVDDRLDRLGSQSELILRIQAPSIRLDDNSTFEEKLLVEAYDQYYQDRDYGSAYKNYKTLAERENKNDTALFNLAVLHCRKDLAYYNESEAFRLFKIAAEDNNPVAQYNMGVIFEYGLLGNKQDMEQAKSWYSRASNQGFEKAKKKIDYLIG